MKLKRFYREFKFFISEVRHGFLRQKRIENFNKRIKPILSMELQSYSLDECLSAAVDVKPFIEDIGPIAFILWSRSHRGQGTLEDVKKAYEVWG